MAVWRINEDLRLKTKETPTDYDFCNRSPSFTPPMFHTSFDVCSWILVFVVPRLSRIGQPAATNLLINFQLQFGSGSVILPPILSILKLLFLFFFFIHRSISNDNYSMHDYCNEIIISHVWIYLFEDIIFKENYYFHRYRKCCE